jgi:hypothetical protein
MVASPERGPIYGDMTLMRRFPRGLALAAVPLLAACSGGESDVETPPYEVVARLADDIEIRRYAPRVAAETSAPSDTAAFRRLFDYIGGENAGASSIAMTAPVETRSAGAEIAMTAPVETAPAGEQDVRMRFFLPAEYDLDAAPEPTHPAVQLVRIEERTEAVLRYSGLPLDYRAESRKERLRATVAESEWAPTGPAVTYYYDPPWTLPWNRRNEITLPVAREGG